MIGAVDRSNSARIHQVAAQIDGHVIEPRNGSIDQLQHTDANLQFFEKFTDECGFRRLPEFHLSPRKLPEPGRALVLGASTSEDFVTAQKDTSDNDQRWLACGLHVDSVSY